MHTARRLLVATLGVIAAPAFAQGGPDELWDMTTRMEMAGMPGQTMNQQVCMKKGETSAESFSRDRNCRVTEQRRSGNKFTWKMVCTGADPMTGSGEMTRSGNSMDGRLQMKGKSGGESVDMTMVYAGKLAGSCDAAKQAAATQAQVAAIQAQSNAQVEQLCRDSITRYATSLFEMQSNPCAAYTGEYCAHVKKTGQSMRTPPGYRKAMQAEGMAGGGWERAAQFCQVPAASIQAAACKSAAGGRDWGFVADYCPTEAEAIAAEQCAGRKYTEVMSSEYKAVCQRYASAGGGASRASSRSQPAAQSQQQQQQQQQQEAGSAPAAPSAADMVKDGANKLRSLFGR